MSSSSPVPSGAAAAEKKWSVRFLLLIAGLGGLLYGVDLGIIAGALQYLNATAREAWHLTAQQLSFIVAAVMLGTVLSSLFAGLLADLFGRRTIMALSGVCFVASIPIIALAEGYRPMMAGRLLQGVSGGLIGVVVPLYLAECLPARSRGKGTGIFQWLLTLGFVVAAIIGLYNAYRVDQVEKTAAGLPKDDAAVQILAAKDNAWRTIFWMSMPPGVLFTFGTLLIAESSRWHFRRGRPDAARAALRRTRTAAEVELEMREMEQTARDEAAKASAAGGGKESLLRRHYVLPFVIALIILACNQTTGINSILAYVVNILNEGGLPGWIANWGDLSIKVLMFLMTIVGVILVDRWGRKSLLMLGTGGIVVSLAAAGVLFLVSERGRTDYRNAFQELVQDDALTLTVDDDLLTKLGVEGAAPGQPMEVTLVYAYGPFTNVLTRRTDDLVKAELKIQRDQIVPDENPVEQFFRRLHLNPFADPAEGRQAPLEIKKAMVGPVPSIVHGWMVVASLFGFIAFFSVGPGVCVWLALSELMPTRIRSNGMSIALLINQLVSTTIAGIFLPTVGNYGYAVMFFFWSACTIVYFLTAAFLLPETKGKTLEEIEAHFRGEKTLKA